VARPASFAEGADAIATAHRAKNSNRIRMVIMMGEARQHQLKRDTVTALLAAHPTKGEPRELSPHEAAQFLADRSHIVIVGDEEILEQRALVWAALHVFGSDVGLLCLLPAFDPRLPRPILSTHFAEWRRQAERTYPAVALAFVPDNEANRSTIDALMFVLAAHRLSTPSSRLGAFRERGAILLFEGELTDGARCAMSFLQSLHRHEVEDLTLN
jgi:hypothetical protein